MAARDALADLDVIVAAAKAGADAALSLQSHAVERWDKDDGSPVSEGDIAADAAIAAVIGELRPDDALVTEERGGDPGTGRRTFIVDPIDGTRAYLAGKNDWSVAVALVEAGRPIAAAVYQPRASLWFTAARGAGAWRNGVRLRRGHRGGRPAMVAAPGSLHTAPGGLRDQGYGRARYVGSLALRLALVADGTFDGVVTKAGPHHWDLAAGDLIVHEAGGSLTSLSGSTLRYDTLVTRHRPVVAGGSEVIGRLRAHAQAHFEAAA